MKLTLKTAAGHDYEAYAYTGGKAFDAAKPTLVFIHGVLNDHSVWILQTRYLAHHGFNVLAVDLPGHGRSGGDAPTSVEEAAQFVAALLDAAGVEHAGLIGHSWGSLIALETAARLKDRITYIALVGTAFPMKVSPALIEASLNEPMKALQMVNVFSRATLSAPPSALGPGTWVYGASIALGRRVLASNTQVNIFHRGFVACDSYANGLEAMAAVTCPVLFVLGETDQMTPPRAAKSLIDQAKAHDKTFTVAKVPMGHHQMTESPEETLDALKAFLGVKA
ncbi:MAG: alpha/beta hydrolase [Burkholderiales bacterium 35-55-47]|jgi:pimeloyl-ACP methyl ester carboxylesterase|uniref:alpha/beta fold hydrolase n=1 Tax=Limnohabitans sp. TaxID=1907725 RepID=UPI000BCCEDB3|nr:alpha/beta hydrolase [Limnohabitans sp.]OYY17495.1 MAG: alpha/beta hydrolase [Burkholderiales bacterium 35-55-47]OYZ72441.1 MAG: alpha/beta hydrolase [Burkholderiales bacterium 24-55-52]OZA99816.1 MAG: alpha/beta hydrolase [Burkholderiales bacterium 39-55-53]HQR85192.1 alpha/beta hydrolase [Limnohabitans sp.]HQS27399.1 alpha/beta hydrolase [Limnohabitans sp.]